MQLLYDLLPVLAFFLTYKIAGIYTATAVLIVAVLLQVVVSLVRHRKVSPMLLTSAALVLVFGGLTLIVHDSTFIKWKPTVVNWLFASAFAASHLFRGPTLIQRMLGQSIQLGDADWKRLSAMWIVFFICAGAANLYVAYNYAEQTWVTFKLFGLMGLTVVFILVQGLWLARRVDQK